MCECLRLLYAVDTIEIMIKSFRHKGIEKFYLKGIAAGIQVKHIKKLRLNWPRWTLPEIWTISIFLATACTP